jgi:hypothetical protein
MGADGRECVYLVRDEYDCHITSLDGHEDRLQLDEIRKRREPLHVTSSDRGTVIVCDLYTI